MNCELDDDAYNGLSIKVLRALFISDPFNKMFTFTKTHAEH